MPDATDSSPKTPLTGAADIRLSSLDQTRFVFNDWRGRVEQFSRGRFDGSLRVVRGMLARVIEIKVVPQVCIQGCYAAGSISVYPITGGCAANLWHGRRFEQGQLVI